MNRGLATFALLIAGVSAACGSPADDQIAGELESNATSSTFYGKDRVGAALAAHPDKIPATFEAYEALFGVGRSCTRTDSKEIFVVEETQTRLAGPQELHEVTPTKLMPRAVIAGCNDGDLSDPQAARKSYSMFAALISDPGKPGASMGDTMRVWPLEVMALDEETGLYNFYVFEPVNPPADDGPVAKDAPGRVTRVYRTTQATGGFNIFERRLQAGSQPTAEKQPIGGGNRCFNCHVEGAPLMNEIRDPWTNWVSFKNTLTHAQMSGLTKELVAEAVPSAETGRASLANDLEPIIRGATTEYVFGSKQTNGWARQVLAGKQPGGVAKMLESVFCETELNYTSASQSLPLEVWLDPDAASPTTITPPSSFGSDTVPFLFPVRSVRDKDTENWLVQKEFLSNVTSLAIRLLDDENDIFSPVRCGLFKEVAANVPTEPAKVHEHVRTIVAAKVEALPFVKAQPARAEYIRQLLRPGVRREVAQRNYLAELEKRFEAMPKTDQVVKTKERFRKARARDKFAGRRSNPLPVLDRE